MKTAIKTFIIISSSIIGIGIVLCIIGFSIAGFNLNKLSDFSEYVEEVQRFDPNDITLIKTDLKNESVIIKQRSGDEIVVTYYTSENNEMSCEETSGVIKLSSPSFPREWFRFIRFDFPNALLDVQKKVVIEIPKSYEKDLDIVTSNGSITLSDDMILSNVSFKTKNSSINVSGIDCEKLILSTANSGINLKNITVEKGVDARTKNSSIKINSCEAVSFKVQSSNGIIVGDSLVASKSIDFKTSNADILAFNINCGNIRFDTSNGDIEGNLLNPQHEYSIRSETSNGDNNLAENSKGSTDKKLDVQTSNADIKIQFAD